MGEGGPVVKRRRFDESKVRRWPAHSPQSRGGEFAPHAGWLGAVEARLPPVGDASSPGGPEPVRPRGGRPPSKPAAKASTTPRAAARVVEQAEAAGWTATVKYVRRPKNGDQWRVTFTRRGVTRDATWTKSPATGRLSYSGDQQLKLLVADLTARTTARDDAGPDEEVAAWVRRVEQQIAARRNQPYGDVSDVDLRRMYDRILDGAGQLPPGQMDEVLAEANRIWDEMVRRDAERFDQGTRLDDDMHLSAEQLQVDDLVSRGMDYLEAVAQVYGNVHQLDRRPGERLDDAARRVYREWLAVSYLAAESATNGHMLTPAGTARGISARSLFLGPVARAGKWASPELLEWWETHPRMTFAEFKAKTLGRASDVRAARRTRERSQDLGLKV